MFNKTDEIDNTTIWDFTYTLKLIEKVPTKTMNTVIYLQVNLLGTTSLMRLLDK